MIPTHIDPGENPGGLVAVLYSDAGRALEQVNLDTDRVTVSATRHAIACSEGGGCVGVYDGDSGDLVTLLGAGWLLASPFLPLELEGL